ncbi:uncharacterized protein THITE_2132786 [Thermothielavioides terrestris NRRL 8126]|uniref:Uncharacterized protein n=1 Tax=Thermothielavioides terrestris (strain ATCC 38088 / NRRL 8126) TaxID=578455 RepID=G2RHY5_THETT|nr:uncharacterized protein THITE_2132786 [Thermothielavioides terrestris NRRL 8126]AEO71447.1 hypothetical protein THITE_2132786 [Thermothielavioides terrestris NRRL 8126]
MWLSAHGPSASAPGGLGGPSVEVLAKTQTSCDSSLLYCIGSCPVEGSVIYRSLFDHSESRALAPSARSNANGLEPCGVMSCRDQTLTETSRWCRIPQERHIHQPKSRRLPLIVLESSPRSIEFDPKYSGFPLLPAARGIPQTFNAQLRLARPGDLCSEALDASVRCAQKYLPPRRLMVTLSDSGRWPIDNVLPQNDDACRTHCRVIHGYFAAKSAHSMVGTRVTVQVIQYVH